MTLNWINNRLYKVVAMTVCCLLSFGCSQEEEETGSFEHLQEVPLQLQVNAADNANETTQNNDEFKMHTLRVYAFADIPDDPSKDGRLVGHYYTDNITVVPHSFNMNITFYTKETQSVNFYVVANEGAMSTPGVDKRLSDKTTETELKNYTFTVLSSDIAKTGLPLFYQSTNAVELQKNGENRTLTFKLKRPVGKLGVFAAKVQGEEADLKVTGLTLLESGTRPLNYLMLQTEETLKKLEGNFGPIPLSLIKESVNKELTEAQISSPEEKQNPANYTSVLATPFYPFENPWGSHSWNTPEENQGNVLKVDYTFGNEARSGLVYLPPIVRNHYYAVCCLMRNDGTISVEYTVADWNSEIWNLEFNYPTYSNPIKPYGLTAELQPGERYPQPTVYYNPAEASTEGSYPFEFFMSGPEGQTWTVTLLDNPADFTYSVWQNDQDKGKGPYVASPDPYIIRIKANDPKNIGTEVRLGIAYTPTWDESESRLLLINGLTNNLKWVGSTNAETIVIKQIDSPTTN